MAYHFEELGDERFQQLCQAVLTREFPDLQCLPVGQPDGGRDAFVRGRVRTRIADSLIYQVKFVRDPNSRDARDLIEAVPLFNGGLTSPRNVARPLRCRCQ